MKKSILLFVCLTIALVQSVTGTTLPNLTDLPTITDDDLFYVVDDPSGTPTDRKSSASTVATYAIAYDSEVSALAGLTSAADKLPYFTGAGTAGTTDLSAFTRTYLDDANEATFKATVNLEIGTDVQAYNAQLANLAAQGVYDGNDSAAFTNIVYAETATLDLSGVLQGNSSASLTNVVSAEFEDAVLVADEAYNATTWNGSVEVPTKNALRDKIETLGGGVDHSAEVDGSSTGNITNFVAGEFEDDIWLRDSTIITELTNKVVLDGSYMTNAIYIESAVIVPEDATASRNAIIGADGTLTNDVAWNGTGAPVRTDSPVFTTGISTPEITLDGASLLTQLTNKADAASAFATDNVLIRADGTGRGVQSTALTADDNAGLTGIAKLGWGQSAPNIVGLGTISGGGTATLTSTNSTFGATFNGSTATIALPGSPEDGVWVLHATNTYGGGSQIITVPSLVRPEYDYDTPISTITNSATSGGKFTIAFTAIGGDFIKFSAVGDDYTPGSGTAPADADYLVGTANGTLTAEIVVGTSPGGELGGSWASPTIDDGVTVANWTLGTPTITGAITLPDGVRQTFNPDATVPGINVGSYGGDPGSPSNGDLWYNSSAHELTARINSVNVDLGVAATADSITIDGAAVDTTANFVSTGDINFTLSDGGAGGPDDVSADLNADVVASAEMADDDHGDVSWSGGTATVQGFVLNEASDAGDQTIVNAGDITMNDAAAVRAETDTSDDYMALEATDDVGGTPAQIEAIRVVNSGTSDATTVYVGNVNARAVVELDATADQMANEGYNGVVITGRNAGEAIDQGNLVFWNTTDSEWYEADADEVGHWPARGVALSTGSDGNPLDVLVQGVMRHDDWSDTFVVGATIFLSDNPADNAGITDTAPSTSGDCVQVVGWALTVDEVYFNFSGHYLEVE